MGSPTRRTPVQTVAVTPAPVPPPVNTGKPTAGLKAAGGSARRKVEAATIMNQGEAAAAIGITRGTLHVWKQNGCPGIEASGVNLGKVLAWREQKAEEQGRNGERMANVLNGQMSKADIDAQIRFHDLLEVSEKTVRRRSEFIPVDSVTGNQSVMLGRMMSILRMLPDTLDEELELAMSCTCGGCEIKRSERRAIVRSACDTLAEFLNADRIVNGFDEEVPKELEDYADELIADDEDEIRKTAKAKASDQASRLAAFMEDDD